MTQSPTRPGPPSAWLLNTPVSRAPTMPPTPWMPNTSSESSAPSIFFRPVTPQRQAKPATKPMTIAPIRPTLPQAGVIATRPATAPDAAPSIEGLPLNIASPMHQASTAADGGREGVDEGQHRRVARFQRRAGVEAEPADPQQRGADHGQRQRVRGERLAAVADALADHVGADQAGDRGVDVHDRAAGEVERAHLPDEAGLGVHRVDDFLAAVGVRAHPEPDHVGDRRIAEGEPQRHEEPAPRRTSSARRRRRRSGSR